jgi:predicted ATPase
MKTARLTIKNYRTFSDSHPAVVEIGPGFTAFLGPNNSGKSSLKLLFYEIRQLFEQLTQNNPQINPNAYSALFTGAGASVNYQGITDTAELFNNNSNSRPIQIEIEILSPHARSPENNSLNKAVATCRPDNPSHWTFETYAANDPSTNLSGGGFNVISNEVVSIPSSPRAIDCFDFFETVRLLRDARYYGPFRNAINQGGGTHYDLRTGTAFIDLWNTWKTSGIKANTSAINQVTEEIRRLFEFERLEINASGTLQTLIVTIDRNSYRLNELGSGLAQFIMVLGNAATSKPSLLLLDEPETNLHPSLQIDFLLSVANYASHGCVFSTHSVGLARSVADRIYSFQKKTAGTIVKPFEAISNYVEFVGELSFSTFKDMGGTRLLLVEGVNDVKTVQQLLRLVRKEHSTVILPLGGDQLTAGGREAELSELARLSNNIVALVDSERHDPSAAPSERRLRFERICKQLNIEAHLTRRRTIENYFPNRAVKAALGGSFQSLGPYERLSDSPNGWRKADSWKIARHMVIGDIEDTDLGQFISRI